MEAIDIGLSDLEPVSINLDQHEGPSKVSFGSGIELLMNGKPKAAGGDSASLDLGDLDDLESEMNSLSARATAPTPETHTAGGFVSNLFGTGGNNESVHASRNPSEESESHLGSATRDSAGSTKTWDGYSKMNDAPNGGNAFPATTMSDREQRRKKRMMIKKLEDWHEKGQIKHNSNFTLESPYEDIEDEYETAVEDKRKKEGVKLQQWWFMTFVNSLEYANAAFNPFDLNLDGWGEQVSEDIDSYDEIFSELHDKYKGGKLAPEVSLVLRLGFSAAVLNFSNKALSSATPAFNDVIKQSPELMKMFTNATVSSMSQQSPGFEFANNLMQDNSGRAKGPPPPAPVETQNQPPPSRPGMTYTDAPSNRPDLNAGRGAMFQERGVDVNQNFEDANKTARPEMKGPQSSDIDNILSLVCIL